MLLWEKTYKNIGNGKGNPVPWIPLVRSNLQKNFDSVLLRTDS